MIRLTPADAPVELGALFQPPDGYRFVDGYLVTYELSIQALVERVLAPLAGSAPDELLETAQTHPALTVAYERRHPGPMVPTYLVNPVRTSSREARPLHAKGGLLRFEPIDRRGASSPRLRGWIGSANLTEGGLARNRELVLAGERTTRSGDEVVRIAVELCRAVAEVTGSRAALREVLTGFRVPHQPSGALLHTVTERRRLLDGVAPPEGFDRLDIITPPFQSKGSGKNLARELAPVLPAAGGKVNIYTSTRLPLTEPIEDPGPTAFPVSLLEVLRSRGLDVQVHITPEVIEGRHRRMHAKALLLHGTTTSVVLIGSANCTVSGLGGRNREAMTVIELSRAQAEQLVHDAFGVWSWTDADLEEELLEPRDVDDARSQPDLPEAFARFMPDDDPDVSDPRGRWIGTLTVEGLTPGQQVAIQLPDGRTAAATVDDSGCVDVGQALEDPALVLSPEDGSVRVTTPDGIDVQVVVYLDASNDWITRMIGLRNQPPRPRSVREVHELHLLLHGLREAHVRLRGPLVGRAYTDAVADDRLSLPLDRRFDFVAKHASQLPQWADDDVVRSFLEVDEDDPRFVVARAIKRARVGHDHDRLLRQLQAAVREAGAR